MSNAASTPPAAFPGRLAALDGLRFVAALSVLAFHYFFRGSAEPVLLDFGYPEAASFALYGYLGVSLFFMISGFVIAWSAEGRSCEAFAVLRFARIYPAFLICMTGSFLVMTLAGDARFPVSAGQWLANFFIFAPAAGFGFIDGVYWSIVLELIFYGWMTLAIITGLFKAQPLGLVAIWMMLSALNEFVLDNGGLRLLFITEYSAWFAAGILMYRMRVSPPTPVALALFLSSLLLAIATSFGTRGWMLDHYGIGLSNVQLTIAVLALFAIFIATVVWGSKLRSSPVSVALGGLTYPLYLLHQNIGYIALNWLTPYLGRCLAAAIITIALVALSYLIFAWIEAPLRRWLTLRLSRRLVATGGTSDNAGGNQALSA